MHRTPSIGSVAVAAVLVGALVGSISAAVGVWLEPWQVGDFRPAGDVPSGTPHGLVEAPETDHGFGTVNVGSKGRHAFPVRNPGTGPLHLSRGATSCTCTIAGFAGAEGAAGDSITLPPGGATEVVLEWQGKGAGGPFRQQATILTDDPRRPEVVFVVHGTVVPSWKAVPEAIQLARLPVTGGEAEARIFTYGEPSPEVVSIAVDHPQAGSFRLETAPLDSAEIAAEAGATGGLRVRIGLPPGLPLGRLRTQVRLVVRTPEETTIELPVEGVVAGDLLVAGAGWDRDRQALLLGTVSGRKGLRTELFITARGPERERFRPVVREVFPEVLRVTIGELSPVGTGSVVRVPIEIEIPPGSRAVNHLCSQQGPAGRIVLDTGHPDTPEFTIPVCVAIGP